MIAGFSVLMIMGLLLIGCTNEIKSSGFGSLTLFSNKLSSRTIQPDGALIAVAKYKVSGIGPAGVTFTPIESETSPIPVNNLVEGSWTMTVEGLNDGGTTIASKTLKVDIAPGQNTEATFDLQWIKGFGNLDVTVTWPTNVTTFTSIHGSLSQGITDIQTFDLMAENANIVGALNTITQNFSGLATGSYDFVLTFQDNNGIKVGLPYMEQVNIYDGMTSIGTCSIPEIIFPLEAPVIDPAGGRIAIGQQISITSPSTDCLIYYTTDGSNPTVASTLYTDVFKLEKNSTVKAIVLDSSRFASEIVSADFVIPAASPTFSVSGGTYDSPQTITLACTTAGAIIHYTLDGTDPTETSAMYSSALVINKNMTVKAIAIHGEYGYSAVATEDYQIVGSLEMDIIDPSFIVVALQLPAGWEGETVEPNAEGAAIAVVSPTPAEGEVTYTWYLDGEEAKNNSYEIASKTDTLLFGDAANEVPLDIGPHMLTVKVTKDSMTYSDQKSISVEEPQIPYTISFDAQGGVTPSPVSIRVIDGRAYGSLAVTTRTGYTFLGWFTETQGTGTEITAQSVVDLDADQTLYAAWTPTDGYISVRLTSTTDPTDVRETILASGYIGDGSALGLSRELPGTPLALEITSSSNTFDYTWIMATDEPRTYESSSEVDNIVMIYMPIESSGTLSPFVEFNLSILFPEYNNPIWNGEYTQTDTYQYSSYGKIGEEIIGTYSIASVPFFSNSIDGSSENVSLGSYLVEFEFRVRRTEGVHLDQ